MDTVCQGASSTSAPPCTRPRTPDRAAAQPGAHPAGLPSAALAVRVPMFGPLDQLVTPLYREFLAGRPARAARSAAAVLVIAERLGDTATLRFAADAAARASALIGEPGARREATARLLGTLEAADAAEAARRTDDEAWRAVGLAHLASALLDEGRVSDALEVLAQALGIVEGPGAASVVTASAGTLVSAVLARLMLFEAAVDLLAGSIRPLRGLPASPHRAFVEYTAARCLFDVHTLWAYHLDLSGRSGQADVHCSAAASAALRAGRLAQDRPLGPLDAGAGAAARALALEAFVTERLGGPVADLAGNRAQVALAELPAQDPPFEAQPARLALARSLARRGDRPAARRLVGLAQEACRPTGHPGWDQVCQLVAAEIEDDRAGDLQHPAIVKLRQIAASGLERIWRDRQSRLDDLRQRIRGWELERHVARTARELLVDPLTGLGNRRLLESALRAGRATGAVFIDVDNFKAINDTWGHPTGDAVLRRLATVLRSCCRSDDTVLRYGGDEFVVLPAPGTPAGVLGQRVLARVREQDWSDLVGGADVRVSVGSADSPALMEALRRSDEAVLRAKRSGRDILVHG